LVVLDAMKHILRFLTVTLIALFGSRLPAQRFDYVVRDVSVIRPELAQPMTPHQDVYIHHGKIVKITLAASEPPKHSMHIIEGAGKYLMAGLTDMHVHMPTENREQFCWLNLAAGVTTLRSMRGKPEHLELRKQIMKGEMTGPDLILASPYFPNKNIKKLCQGLGRARLGVFRGADARGEHSAYTRGRALAMASTDRTSDRSGVRLHRAYARLGGVV
jgi:hypothetical protein